MAKATLIFTDIDLGTGGYKADFGIEGAVVDDGHITAAHLTGLYIFGQMKNPEFTKKVGEYAPVNPAPDSPKVVFTLTITDIDLDQGSYNIGFNVENITEDQPAVTAAHVIGLYLLSVLHTPEFVSDVWDFARTLVDLNAGASIANNDNAPADLAAAS